MVLPIIILVGCFLFYIFYNIHLVSKGKDPIPLFTEEDFKKWEERTEREKERYEMERRLREEAERNKLTEADIRNFVNRVESAGYNVDFLKKK